MNITDVDDKIIAKSLTEKKTCTEVSNYYLASFLKDLHSLNILPFNAYVPVTSQIDNIIEYVQLLEKNGYVYLNEKTGDIDLDAGKVDQELSNFKTDSNLPGKCERNSLVIYWKFIRILDKLPTVKVTQKITHPIAQLITLLVLSLQVEDHNRISHCGKLINQMNRTGNMKVNLQIKS